jgi:hypothetical protein
MTGWLSLNPKLPLYGLAAKLLAPLAGASKSEVSHLLRELELLRGTRGAPRDWSNAGWRAELSGTDRHLAERLWAAVPELSPGRLYGTYLLINKYGLLEHAGLQPYVFGEKAERFIAGDRDLLTFMDLGEGMIALLAIVADSQNFQLVRSQWEVFCSRNTHSKSQTTMHDLFRHRIANLSDRKVLVKHVGSISLTAVGEAHLGDSSHSMSARA